MEKPSLNGNVLPLDTITGFYTFLGQWDLHEPAGTASSQSVPAFCPVCLPTVSALTTSLPPLVPLTRPSSPGCQESCGV